MILSENMKNKSISSANSERIDFIDVFRGIGIILMVAGHVGLNPEFDKLIHAFHMPMFFFVSGYFFKDNKNFKDVLIKKSKTLLVPYAVFGTAIALFYVVKNFAGGTTTDFGALIKCFLWDNSVGMPPVWAMWFLTALFLADIIYFLISKYIHNDLLKSVVILAIAAFGSFETVLLPFRLPWSMGAAFVGIGLYHIGAMMKKYKSSFMVRNLLHMKWYVWILLSIICSFLIHINGHVNMRNGFYDIVPLFWINAVLASCLLFNFSRVITDLFNKSKCLSVFIAYLKSAGKNSIVYVCLNQLIIAVMTEIMNRFNFPSEISFVIVFVLTMALLWLAAVIITKSKLKILIGK